MFRPESLLMKTYAPMFAEHFKYRDHKALLADIAPDQEEIWTAHCVSASFSPDGARLLVAYDTGFVHIVRVSDCLLLEKIQFSSPIRDAQFYGNGEDVYVLFSDDSLRLSSGEPLYLPEPRRRKLLAMRVYSSESKDYIALLYRDEIVVVPGVRGYTRRVPSQTHHICGCITGNGTLAFVEDGRSGEVQFMDLRTMNLGESISTPYRQIEAIAVTENEDKVAIWASDFQTFTCSVWDVGTKCTLATLFTADLKTDGITSHHISIMGKYCAVGGTGSKLLSYEPGLVPQLWNLETGDLLRFMRFEVGSNVIFSPDGKTFATRSPHCVTSWDFTYVPTSHLPGDEDAPDDFIDENVTSEEKTTLRYFELDDADRLDGVIIGNDIEEPIDHNMDMEIDDDLSYIDEDDRDPPAIQMGMEDHLSDSEESVSSEERYIPPCPAIRANGSTALEQEVCAHFRVPPDWVTVRTWRRLGYMLERVRPTGKQMMLYLPHEVWYPILGSPGCRWFVSPRKSSIVWDRLIQGNGRWTKEQEDNA